MNDKLAIAKLISKFVSRTCPHCLKEFTLGVDGVQGGCDSCEGIVRLPNGMVDYDATYSENFIEADNAQ